MNILVITPSVPYPLDSGSPIRNYNLIRELSREHSITLLTLAHRPADLANIEQLRPYCVRLEAVPHLRSAARKLFDLAASFCLRRPYVIQANTNSSLRRRILQTVAEQNIDLIHIAELYTAGNVEASKLGVPLIFDAHNCEALILTRLAGTNRRSLRAIYWRAQAELLKAFEEGFCRKADCVFCVSPQEQLYFQKLARRVELVPNGVSAGESRPVPEQKPPEISRTAPQLLFTGTLAYPPNADGIAYFLRSIWPLIKMKVPDTRFVIVGRRPPAELQREIRRAGNGVSLLTDIDNIEPYFTDSAVMVVPLRAGAGTRIKILQAFSHRLPVVSTSIGAEGLEIQDRIHAFIADGPEQFAADVLQILENEEAGAGLADRAQQLVQSRYQWPEIVSRGQTVYRELVR